MPFDSMIAAPIGPLPQPLYLLEEISHRVMNEYAAAICELTLAAGSAANAHARATLHHAAARLHLHVEAHRALLTPADDEVVDLAGHLGRICASMTRALLAWREVRLIAEMDAVWMDSGRCWRIGLVVAELIGNAVRHGLAGRAGCVRVAPTRSPGRVHCVVSDNGRAPTGPKQGRGRRLIEKLAAGLGGQLSWRFTPAGCIADLVFPDADGIGAPSYPSVR